MHDIYRLFIENKMVKKKKRKQIFWTATAKADLEEIIEYISRNSLEIAIDKYEKIKESAQTLRKYPEQGRVVPELADQNIVKYLELIIHPWRMMYKVEEDMVFIMAVIDGRRNIEDILLKRQLR